MGCEESLLIKRENDLNGRAKISSLKKGVRRVMRRS
jgi:hypothetical protein